jgi:hypothetical protein
MKMRPDAPDTAENETRRVKHEKGTLRPRYRRNLVREPTPSLSPKISPGAQKHEN